MDEKENKHISKSPKNSSSGAAFNTSIQAIIEILSKVLIHPVIIDAHFLLRKSTAAKLTAREAAIIIQNNGEQRETYWLKTMTFLSYNISFSILTDP